MTAQKLSISVFNYGAHLNAMLNTDMYDLEQMVFVLSIDQRQLCVVEERNATRFIKVKVSSYFYERRMEANDTFI